MIRLFTGWDVREAAGWHAFVDSVYKHASEPVSVSRLPGRQGAGTKAFTDSRFLIPELCDYRGWAIYADGCDMLCRADIAQLWAMRDKRKAVQVVPHGYVSRASRKYLGTPGESDNVMYPRKNWSSVMLMNCDNPATWAIHDHRFTGLDDALIGTLPGEWNWLADEFGWSDAAKLVHWTLGTPVAALHL